MSDVVAGDAVSGVAAAVAQVYCPRCGEPAADADHAQCAEALALEPPRFCGQCRRRMVVQVTPAGWTAVCSRHGSA